MIAVYAGRFDPMTNGHLDIVERATRLFDQVIVAVYELPPERCLFTTDQRVALVASSLDPGWRAEAVSFSGLLTSFARAHGAAVIVRGLRAVTDFSIEFDQALMYKDMADDIEQVYLMSDLRHIFLSASRVREVASLGHDVSHLVPPPVFEALKSRYPAVSE